MTQEKNTILDIGRGETLLIPQRKTLIGGLKIPHRFSSAETHPYDGVPWERRDVEIMDYIKKRPSFSRKGVEVPAHWSDNSVKITAAKYLFGSEPNTPQYEDSLRHPFDRIANTYTVWGWLNGYFESEADAKAYNWELKAMLLKQIWAPNSPVWFNLGHWEQWRWGRPDLRDAYKGRGNHAFKAHDMPGGELAVEELDGPLQRPQASACFLTEVEDSMESILHHQVVEGRVFASGSGAGINISKLRSSKEPISGKGRSSGPIPFNKGWDRMAGAIKSGGKTRRAARMVLMDSDHPDTPDFIGLKNSQEDVAKIVLREHNSKVALKKFAAEKAASSKAEELVKKIIGEMPVVNDKTYDGSMDGEIYGETVSDQNANHSVSLLDDFWRAYWSNGDYSTRWVTDKSRIHETFPAKNLMVKMAESVWHNAEPGCHNNDWINLWNPVKTRGRIDTSNPCVTGDTLVAGKGLSSIESLVGTEPEIVGSDAELHKAKAVFPTGTKPVYQLRTASGFGIRLTGDHAVTTTNRGDVPAHDLTKDDTLRLVGANFGSVHVETAIAWLAGYAIGNGCVSTNGDQRLVSWTFGKQDRDLAEKVAQMVNDLKKEKPMGDGRSDAKVSVVETDTGLRVATSRPDIVGAMETLAVLDQGSAQKALKPKGLQLNEESMANLLCGYADADGTVQHDKDKNNHVALDSCSELLLEQIQVILLSFEIKGKLYRNRRADKSGKALLPDGKGGIKEYPVEQMHSLRISRSNRIVFAKRVGFSHPTKKDILNRMNAETAAYADSMTDKVASLEFIGNLPVFDLTEPTTSHFVANGIVVHNCSEYLFLNGTSCNLSSFNAYRFLKKDGSFDKEALRHGARMAMIAADLNIEECGFPDPDIAKGTYSYRTTGIGYGNIGGLLMALGIPYDSDEGRYFAGLLVSHLTAYCWEASQEMGEAFGPYREYEDTKDDLAEVLRLHKACHEFLREIPEIRNPEETMGEIVAQSGKLPTWGTLDGKAALRALLNSFDQPGGDWDPGWLQTAKGLESENPWNQINPEKVKRNSFVSLSAPGGTISAPLGIYDSGTTSIEPDYTLVKYKTLSGGGSMTMFNNLALKGLQTLGYDQWHVREAALEVAGINGLIVACDGNIQEAASHLADGCNKGEFGTVRAEFCNHALPKDTTILDVVVALSEGKQTELPFQVTNGTGNVEGIPWLPDHHKRVFDCAATLGGGKRSIEPAGHIKMLGAIQPFLSGSSSKTCNLPHDATVDDIVESFELSHKMGVKCIALYRADSKGVSVYSSDSPEAERWKAESMFRKLVEQAEAGVLEIQKEASKPRRRKLPGRRDGTIVKFVVGGQMEGFLVVGIYPDGRCGEVFGRLGQGGSFSHGMFESFCKAFSVMLQWGVPLPNAIASFRNTAFDPAGFARVGETNDQIDIKSCKSVVDLMMKMLEWLFPEDNNFRLRDRTGETFESEESHAHIEHAGDDNGYNHKEENLKKALSAAEMCPSCGSLSLIQDGKCKRCSSCGYSGGGCGG